MIPTYHAITGRMAQPIRDALAKEIPGIGRVWLVREHRCGLTPKMYEDKPGHWIPINGGSLLSPEWSIARHLRQVEKDLDDPGHDWLPRADMGPTFNGLVCIDSEAYFPRVVDTSRDAQKQFSTMFADAQYVEQGYKSAVIEHALSTYFTSFCDQVKLCRPKARVGFYGLPTWRDGSLTDAVERRVDVTFPCCYTSKGDPSLDNHAYETAYDRVARAKREAPTKPAIAFVCPFREVAGLPPLDADTFTDQCHGARDGGADGLCVWWDANDTAGLTKFLGVLDVVKAGVVA